MVHAPVYAPASSPLIYAPHRPDPALPPVRVNLYSDTQTKPSMAMKEAMLRAELGDEQHGDDPTIHALNDRMAALLGKEAAMFLPSGTMCNQIAIVVHCRRGDEILAHESSHIVANEGGGPGSLAGAVILGLRGERGQFDADTVRAAMRERRRNSRPGRRWAEQLVRVSRRHDADQRGISLHHRHQRDWCSPAHGEFLAHHRWPDLRGGVHHQPGYAGVQRVAFRLGHGNWGDSVRDR